MVTISQNELDQVVLLIEESHKGNHIIFDENRLKKAFEKINSGEKPELEEKPECILERLIAEPTILKKKRFLADLNETEFQEVVRIYFNMVEQHLTKQKCYLQ